MSCFDDLEARYRWVQWWAASATRQRRSGRNVGTGGRYCGGAVSGGRGEIDGSSGSGGPADPGSSRRSGRRHAGSVATTIRLKSQSATQSNENESVVSRERSDKCRVSGRVPALPACLASDIRARKALFPRASFACARRCCTQRACEIACSTSCGS